MLTLPQNFKIVSLLNPAADAAGRTSAVYCSLKNCHRATIICHLSQGAVNTVQLDPLQAVSVAGGSSKALTNACRIWSALDVSISDSLIERTAAKLYVTDAPTKTKVVVFEITPLDHLDVAGGFDCLGISTGASAAANITEAIAILEERYAGTLLPSSIID